ncbi:MAG: oxidoreductase [Bacteroidia bacterium]|nr:oxidoreductase [Bacteroidia bacterium]
MRKYLLSLLPVLFFLCANAQVKLTLLDSTTFRSGKGVILSKTSFRGLSVVSKKVIWVSGNRGTYGRSTNGGKSFFFTQLDDYNKIDFRDIEAFDAKNAVMMSSGSPAYILKTTDGGATWKEVYKNTRPDIFLDAMDFWDKKHGMIVGDPIDHHFVLLETKDGGNSWAALDTVHTPFAGLSEAVFAASGTSLRCFNKNEFGFVTGGEQSRFIHGIPQDNYFTWIQQLVPVRQGKSSQGAFSFAIDGKLVIVAGGDYQLDTSANSVCAVTLNYELDAFISVPPIVRFTGYRSCVEILDKDFTLACGSTGVDLSRILYPSITVPHPVIKISKEAFNVVRKSKKGKAIYIAGNKGHIGRIIRL